VAKPEANVLVVANPRSSQPTTVSRPAANKGEDGDGEGATE
jgi:hypothetical protein